jgi:hypothetical protein
MLKVVCRPSGLLQSNYMASFKFQRNILLKDSWSFTKFLINNKGTSSLCIIVQKMWQFGFKKQTEEAN